MKTLIIDNYDSFTFNLYQIIAKINGIPPLVIRNDRVSRETIKSYDFDNIIISPGPGHPGNERDFGICRQLILESSIPLLGVCLGHQGIGYLHGGIVQRASQVMHGRLSNIYHDRSELFRGIESPFLGVRYHSLIVEEPLPPILERIAWTADNLLMGLRHREKPFWGVQFHPESICSEYGVQLLENFQNLTYEFWDGKPGRQIFSVELPDIISAVPSGKPISQDSNFYEVHTRKLDFFRNSEDVFVSLYQDSPVAFWLDSSRVEPGLSRFSFMGDASGPESFLVSYRVDDGELTISQGGTTISRQGNIFDFLKQELQQRYCQTENVPFDFNCGFVGYFGYELKADCEAQAAHTSPLPDATFLFADRLIVFDHLEQTLFLVCCTKKEASKTETEAWFHKTESQLRTLSSAPPVQVEHCKEPITFWLSRSYETYLHDIQVCLDEINRGETYEVCLTNHVRTDYRPNPINFYRTLRQLNPAPYSAFLRFNEMAVACSSPERFLRISRDRWVESKPIKGTSKRGETPVQDALLKNALQNSEKNRAENLMIVDLLRNDLGLVCEVGTVQVPKLMHIETYARVHQMLSTVRGYLRLDMQVIDCIRMTFPGGSMTGAPKKRTMEIIDRLEREARGVYSGSIGFLALNSTADLNIVIRTAVISPTDTTIGTGGAIVALSDPKEEFDETTLKAAAAIEAILKTGLGKLDGGKFKFPMAQW